MTAIEIVETTEDPDLMLEEYRERMSIVDQATKEVAAMSVMIERANATRRLVDLNDPKVPLAVKEAIAQEGMNRLTFPSKRYVCPACRAHDCERVAPSSFDSAAQLLLHLLECPSFDYRVTPLLGDARPF